MRAIKRDIVMLGFAGARNALTLAELHRDELQKRFPKHFLKLEEELHKVSRTLSAAVNGQEKDWGRLQEEHLVLLQESEVFPMLWKLAEDLDAGLEVELQKIPISQFVVEICELLDANPYVDRTALENRKCFDNNVTVPIQGAEIKRRDVSGNADTVYGLLIVTDAPEEVLMLAKANEIPAAVIGRLTGKNDRVVRNGEIIRYLTPEG